MEELRAKYIDVIAQAADEAELEDVRIAAVGKGEVALKMRELGKMSPKNDSGTSPNALKIEINSHLPHANGACRCCARRTFAQ